MATLADLIPAGQLAGAGIIARHGGRLLFCIERVERPEGELVCIRVGGRREPGESLADCARREAREEVACEVTLLDAPQTYVLGGAGCLAPVQVEGSLRPLLVYARPFPSSRPGVYHNAIFFARLAAPPRPGPEAETLLLLPDNALFALAQRPMSVSALQDAGAVIVSRVELPPQALVSAERAPVHLAELVRQGVHIG